jgi:hypothetical protein
LLLFFFCLASPYRRLEFEVHEAFDFLLELGLFGAALIIFVDALAEDESAGDEVS